ncbi:hypothetical protein GCM10027566_33400 [Arachidicoccus ginsenosidivorans]
MTILVSKNLADPLALSSGILSAEKPDRFIHGRKGGCKSYCASGHWDLSPWVIASWADIIENANINN